MMPYDSLFIDWEVVDNIEAYFSYDMVYDNPNEIVVTSWTVGWEKNIHGSKRKFFQGKPVFGTVSFHSFS